MTLHVDSIMGFMVMMVGWLASAIILFSLIGVEVRQHQPAQGDQTILYTGNFFAGVISAGLYVLIAVLVSIHMVCVKKSPFGAAERRKIECTSIVFRATTFTILLLGGAAIYSTIEGWSLMDALYFTDYTLLTIGLGNIAPQTHLGRSLLFPYAALGITSLGFIITAVASYTDQMRELTLKRKIEATRSEVDNPDSPENTANGFPIAEGVQSQIDSVRRCTLKREEILRIRHVKSHFYRRRKWIEVGLFVAAWFVLWFVSAGVFSRSEKQDHWTYFVGLYFTYTSLTTIGYGDYFPTSNFGKVFFVFWSLLAIPILTNLVTAFGGVLHVWLLYCSGWIWQHVLRRGRPGDHDDSEHVCQSVDTPGWTSTDRSPNLDLIDSGPNIESQPHLYLETGPGSLCAQDNEKRRDLGGDEQHRTSYRGASIRYWLLLLEEIQILISMMSDESSEHQEKLCCVWSRIIPLFEAEGGADCLSELTPLFASVETEHMAMGMAEDSKDESLKRNSEISWMLKLLVEKLSSDLRKELSERKG